MKKIIKLLIIFSCIFPICSFQGCHQSTHDRNSDTKIFGSGFNEENYIWEGWEFSTNRTELAP